MFRFAKDGRVRWPVTLAQVQADGSAADQTFSVVYRVMTREELAAREQAVDEYIRASRALLPADDADDTAADAEERRKLSEQRTRDDDALLTDRVKDWGGIVDQDDAPLVFSTEMLAAFIGDQLMRSTLLRGLLEASNGARSKNSLPGLAGLPAPAQA